MKIYQLFSYILVIVCSFITLSAQTDFVFDEKEKKKSDNEESLGVYDDSFQSIGVQALGLKEGETPLRWFLTVNNGNLVAEKIGLYIEQQVYFQFVGNTPYTFLGTGLFHYIAGNKQLGLVGRLNAGVSFVSDIRNSSLFGSAITGFGSTLALGLSAGEKSFLTNIVFVVHQTSLLGGKISPGANISVLFKL